MCCLCFERVEKKALTKDTLDQFVNVCKTCAKAERHAVALQKRKAARQVKKV